jgi:hypothetical protein
MSVIGFLITRDVVRGGYPFLEAIHGALGLCDRIHVLDGESSDGTWHALAELREIVSAERLVLHRAPWQPRPRQHPLRAATNQLLEQIPSGPDDWRFHFQANEIVTPDCAVELATALQRHLRAALLRIPVTAVMGLDLVVRTRFRGRLFRSDPLVEAIGDAFDCGVDRRRLLGEPWLAPRMLWLRARTARVELAHPVLRFRAPLPDDYPAKLEARVRLESRGDRLREELEVARAALAAAHSGGLPIDAFWEQIWERNPYVRGDGGSEGPIPPERRLARLPAVLEPLRGAWSYDVERSLAALARREVPVPAYGCDG